MIKLFCQKLSTEESKNQTRKINESEDEPLTEMKPMRALEGDDSSRIGNRDSLQADRAGLICSTTTATTIYM